MNQADQMQQGAEGIEVSEGGGGYKPGTSGAVKAVIFVIVIAIQFVVAHLILKNTIFSKPPAQTKPAQTEEIQAPVGEIYQLSGIIVNPSGSRGTRHLLVDIGIESPNMKVTGELTNLEPQLRDNLITFLTAQKIDVLTDIQMREKIRNKVMDIINYYLTEGQVERVYFIRYVFQ